MSNSSLAVHKPALAEITAALAAQHAAARVKFDAFEADVLINRLLTGLHCLKAYAIFNLADPAKRGQGRKKKNQLTREEISTDSFKGWLTSAAPWLKEGTAYKYMTAVKGLGLDEKSTVQDVEEHLAQNRRIGPVNLKMLCDLAVDAIGPKEETFAPEQTEFEFLREGLSNFRVQADALLALKAELHKNPNMERVAAARIYDLLFQLTGTHWKPSDEPDDLASIDPDSITL